MRFTLTVVFGNDAMQDAYDLADALEKIAADLDHGRASLADGITPIRDGNGNTVGEWEIRP